MLRTERRLLRFHGLSLVIRTPSVPGRPGRREKSRLHQRRRPCRGSLDLLTSQGVEARNLQARGESGRRLCR